VRLRAHADGVPRAAMLRLYRAAGIAADRRGDVARVEGSLLGSGPADRLEVALRDGPAGRTAVVRVALGRVQSTTLELLTDHIGAALDAVAPEEDARPVRAAARADRRRAGGVVLLVNPFRDPDRPDEVRSDMACGTFLLASSLAAAGVPCELVPGALHPDRGLDDPDALYAALARAPAVVGFTVLEACLAEVRTLAAQVARRSDATIAVGGPLVTWTPEHALVHIPAAHVAVRGPGEATLPVLARLLRRWPLDSAAQEALLRLDGVLLHRGRLLIAGGLGVVPDPDPDQTPMDFGLLHEPHVRSGLSLETARGCDHPCLFCTTPGKGRHRGRSAAVVARHLRAYRRRLDELYHGDPPRIARRLQICDDDFPCDPQRARTVLAAIRDSGLQLAAFQASVRDFLHRQRGAVRLREDLLDAVDPALFQDAAAHAEARRRPPTGRPPAHTGPFVHLGVEALNDPDLRRLGKGYRAADVDAVIDALDRRGVVHDAYLILANRGTTLDDLVDTVVALPRYKLQHPHTFYVRTPPVPFVVPTFASGSYRVWRRESARGDASGDVLLDTLHHEPGYPEWDYPLVAGEHPDDPDVRAAAEQWARWFEPDDAYLAPAANLAAWLRARLEGNDDDERAARLQRAIRRLEGLRERVVYRAAARARGGQLRDEVGHRVWGAASALGPAEQVVARARNAVEIGDPRLVLIPTRDCSLRCTYCPAHKEGGREMSARTLRGAVELLLSSDAPQLILQFFGGEALLRREFVLDTLALATARAAAVGKRVGFIVSTNGMDVDEALLEQLATLPLKIEISLDGPRDVQTRHRRPRDPGRDSYDGVARIAPALIASGIPHDVIMVATPETVPRLADSFAHVASLGFRRIQVNHALDMRWDRAAKQTFAAQLQAIGDAFYADGPGAVEWVDLRAWRHPMLLNGEITVDVDGTVYFGNGFLVRHADPADFRAGHLDDLDNLDSYLLRKPDNETLLRHTYAAEITANNVEVGRIYGSFVRHMRQRFPALAEPRETRAPERP